MIEIDGAHLEGGGQIIRTAIALASVTKRAVRIFNIRKGRDKPGLRPQHLEGVKAAARISSGRADGLILNSTEVFFTPGVIKGGKYMIDTETAGSVSLILQTLVPIAIHADSTVELIIKGGTAVPFSPTIAYFQTVHCSMLRHMGVIINVGIKRHGFYPGGGGEICAAIYPAKIKGVDLTEPGKLREVKVNAISSFHLKSARVAERMVSGFKDIIPESKAECEYVPTISPGCFVNSYARFDNSVVGSDVLGRVGKRAEDVGKDAALSLRKMSERDTVLDIHMVDGIIPYMGLAAHRTGILSRVRIPELTRHAETNIWVVEQFLSVKFDVENNVMTCRQIT